jgi:hypothetical protein
MSVITYTHTNVHSSIASRSSSAVLVTLYSLSAGEGIDERGVANTASGVRRDVAGVCAAGVVVPRRARPSARIAGVIGFIGIVVDVGGESSTRSTLAAVRVTASSASSNARPAACAPLVVVASSARRVALRHRHRPRCFSRSSTGMVDAGIVDVNDAVDVDGVGTTTGRGAAPTTATSPRMPATANDNA